MSTRTPPEAGQTQTLALPMQQRAAQLDPATFNVESRTVEVVWTTGARVRRYDWWNDTPYDEELVVSAEACDLTRFDAGAISVLDGHRTYGIDSILGSAVKGWIENGEGRALLRLSQREELAGVVADIQAGVIRNISVGYSVQRYEIVPPKARTDGSTIPLYRAIAWTPAEISFVAVPADAQSGTRSQVSSAGTGLPCEFIRAATGQPTPQEHRMSKKDDTAAAGDTPAADQAAAVQTARSEAEAAALVRAADITALCTRHKVPEMAEGMIRGGKTVEQAGHAILDELAARDKASGGHRNVRTETVADEQETLHRGIEEALSHRVDARVKLTDNGRQFRGMSLLELGRTLLETHGRTTRGMDRLQLAGEILQFRSGMHTSGDFSSLLANVASKRLRDSYDENPGSYRRWARRAPNAPDFKSMNVVQLSGMPDLLKVNEAGEFKYGVLKDGGESYGLLTYGRIVSLSRQAIVNDDLRAFDRMVTGFGGAAARLENRTVYAQLTDNAALGDAVALFHATHANLGTGGGSALQFSALDAGRKAMRLQKGLQSEELNLVPTTLIVPAALEQTAYQLTSANYVPATKAEINEFRSGGRTSLDPVIEPILDANSATAWYLAASNTQVDTVEFCYLDGAEGPQIESQIGFEIDGMQIKARLDFAAKVIDYRGLYKANGA